MFLPDRRLIAARNAMEVVRAYEEQVRTAALIDVSAGYAAEATRILDAFRVQDLTLPACPSVDYLSMLGTEVRMIEVKGRGGFGPITVIERELDTLTCAGQSGWLYVVWNTTQPSPYAMRVIRDPQRLPWRESRPATRARGEFRGARHEAAFTVDYEAIERYGEAADLRDLELPPKD
ncbi:hypothetical protein ACFROC_25765 [Nocardia tengchongensis]|uniref:hypothetical protein n=1 Tax=Nocardia tengchongensis TaxID=2055889 RepID=UPI0036B7EADF